MVPEPCSTTEYALFNKLPEGMTIEQIPPRLRWLYIYPFRTSPERKTMERVMHEINRERSRLIPKMDYRGDVKTLCELRERTITYGEWKISDE